MYGVPSCTTFYFSLFYQTKKLIIINEPTLTHLTLQILFMSAESFLLHAMLGSDNYHVSYICVICRLVSLSCNPKFFVPLFLLLFQYLAIFLLYGELYLF